MWGITHSERGIITETIFLNLHSLHLQRVRKFIFPFFISFAFLASEWTSNVEPRLLLNHSLLSAGGFSPVCANITFARFFFSLLEIKIQQKDRLRDGKNNSKAKYEHFYWAMIVWKDMIVVFRQWFYFSTVVASFYSCFRFLRYKNVRLPLPDDMAPCKNRILTYPPRHVCRKALFGHYRNLFSNMHRRILPASHPARPQLGRLLCSSSKYHLNIKCIIY